MRCRDDRDHRLGRIDARLLAVAEDGRELRREVRHRRTAIEIGAPPGLDLGEDSARHHVARGQFGVRVQGKHEAFAGAVVQRRAMAAQRLGGERRGILANVDGGRVELHELHVGHPRAGTRRHADAAAAGFCRVGGDLVEMADASGGHHHVRAGDAVQFLAGAGLVPSYDAGDPAVLDDQILDNVAFQHPDRGRLAHRGHQRLHDGAACHVTLHPHDPALRMRSFPAHRQMAFEVPVERHGRSPADHGSGPTPPTPSSGSPLHRQSRRRR